MDVQQSFAEEIETEEMSFEGNDNPNGSDSSDSDDSEKEREEHYVLERRIVELRKELAKSPNAYNTHVELISSLKKLGELDQLRYARESMHAIYPLTEELWLDWLRDEIKLGLTDEDKKKIELLFQRATEDYLSIDIWVEYIQFCLAGMDIGGVEALKKIRAVMEEAIRHGGLHVVKGALLWDSYRDFEMAIYQTTKGGSETENTSQAQRITHLFNRQLSVPLLDMERTWTEYNEWLQILDQKIEPHVKATYDKAKGQMEKIAPIEDTLIIAVENDHKVAAYRTYLDLEMNEFKDPARIQALFERIVAEMPLYDSFWNDYCKFVDHQFKAAETTFAIFKRAIRNCPWNGPIWSEYILAAERGLVEKAFNAGLATAADLLSVWMSFIEYVEFEDEVSATMAMNQTDGTTFQDKVLTVALSNPPPRREDRNLDKDEPSLGGGPRVRRTQVSFVPNAVLRQTPKSSTMPPPASVPVSASKSNADFRSMLLKK